MSITIGHNPFATTFTRPGEIPYLLNDGESLEQWVEDFRANGFISQIVGQHGAGKTSLTLALIPGLEKYFDQVRRITIRQGSNVLAHGSSRKDGLNRSRQLLIVDGVERLSWLHRWLLVKHARNDNAGLLITTHRQLKRVPVLCEVRPTLATFERIVDRLAPELNIDHQILKTAFEKNAGSIRESLMTLYNWYENQQSPTAFTPN